MARVLFVAIVLTSCKSLGDPCNPPRETIVHRVVPPKDNPYPPASDKDKTRVRIAELAMQRFYTTRLDEADLATRMKVPHDPALDDVRPGPDAFPFHTKSLACISDIECWSKDYAFLRRIRGHASMWPAFVVAKVRHVHVVPWSTRRASLNESQVWDEAKKDYARTSDPLAFSYGMPRMKPDEYLVDAIVEMKKKDGYYHLLFVLADDEKGEPGLRWFEMAPIQNVTQWSCMP